MKMFKIDAKGKQAGEIINPDDFISAYSSRYYLGGERGTGSTQNSGYVESVIDRILKEGIQTEKDFLRVIAWKMGKIRHKDTEGAFKKESGIELKQPEKKDYENFDGDVGFAYSEDWHGAGDFEAGGVSCEDIDQLYLRRYGNHVEIGCLAKFVVDNEAQLYKEAVADPCSAIKKIAKLAKEKSAQIGKVYVVTLLYFLSRGEYPIYDKYADKAL